HVLVLGGAAGAGRSWGWDFPYFCQDHFLRRRGNQGAAVGIVQRPGFEHCNQHSQEPIADAAERASVVVAPLSQAAIVRATPILFTDTPFGPPVKGRSPAPLTGRSHADHLAFPTPFR